VGPQAAAAWDGKLVAPGLHRGPVRRAGSGEYRMDTDWSRRTRMTSHTEYLRVSS
jgi:hypothetical protein